MRGASAGLAAAAVLLTAACGQKVVVGVVLPESGENKVYGSSLKAGITLAFDDAIAKQSPVGIEAHYRDSLSHPEYAAKEAQELYKSGALVVIGGATSAEAKAMIPEAEKAQALLISPSASEPGLAATSNLFFRVVPSDEFEAKVAAKFLATQKKVHTVMVLFEKGLYADGLVPVFTSEFEKAGGKITGQLSVGPMDWDKAVADAIPAQKPDAIFVCAYAEEILASLGVIRNAHFPGVVCVTSSFDTGDVVKRAGALANGVFVSKVGVDFDSQQEPIRSFVKRFKLANRGATPDLFAAYGFDAATAALDALRDPPPKNVNDLLVRLMSLGDKQGVTGKFVFDKVGNITHYPRMHVIKDGRFEDCDTAPLS
ncbi:MAG TPA: ABC transporter substrate-binding protein [Thermoanaerobaculaceae bacterium]|nr:ABC transporter substrate-binding protein [Thermoanaerobaculaceae bacterium]